MISQRHPHGFAESLRHREKAEGVQFLKRFQMFSHMSSVMHLKSRSKGSIPLNRSETICQNMHEKSLDMPLKIFQNTLQRALPHGEKGKHSLTPFLKLPLKG